MEKLKRQLADADAALEARKKPPEDAGPKIIGEGLVIDEWVSFFGPYVSGEIHCEMNSFIEFVQIVLFRRRGGKDILLDSRGKVWTRHRVVHLISSSLDGEICSALL